MCSSAVRVAGERKQNYLRRPDFSSCVEQGAMLIGLVKSNRMGKQREKRRRKANRQRQRPGEEVDLVREKEMERVEREDAQRRAQLSPKQLRAHPGGAQPPILGESDPLVRAPLKPKPHLRSGAIALPEPEPEDAVLTVNPRSVSK
jgi:hypothetical protein